MYTTSLYTVLPRGPCSFRSTVTHPKLITYKNTYMKLFQQLLCCCMALLLLNTGAIAQQKKVADTARIKWRIGFVNGVSLNYFTAEQPHTGYAAGYAAHITGDWFVAKNLFIRVTTGYTGYGGQLVTFKDDTRYGFEPLFAFKNTKQSQYILHAIDNWLGLNYQIPSKQTWKCNIGLGAGMAINVGEYEQYTKTGEFIPGIYGTVYGNQYTDRFEPYWYQANANAEIVLPSKKLNWVLQGSYVVGLTSVRKNYSYIEFPGITGSIRTNAFQVKLGISKNFKSRNKSN